jgi:hypothetical protein
MLTTPRAVLLGLSLIAVAIVLQPIALNDWTSASQDISFSQLQSDVDQEPGARRAHSGAGDSRHLY